MHHAFHQGFHSLYQLPWLPSTRTSPFHIPPIPPRIDPMLYREPSLHSHHANQQLNQYQTMVHDLSRCLEKEIFSSRFDSQSTKTVIGKKTRGRKRSSTVSVNPSRENGNFVAVPADDKSAMLDYYTKEEVPARRKKPSSQRKGKIRKASSTGTLADYIALSKAPNDEKLLAKIPNNDLETMIPHFRYLKEIGPDKSSKEYQPDDDLFLLDPPSLVIDLPEELSIDGESCPPTTVSSKDGKTMAPDGPPSTPSQERSSPSPTINSGEKLAASPLSADETDRHTYADKFPVYWPTSLPVRGTVPNPTPDPTNEFSTSKGKFNCKRCSHHFPSITKLVQHRKSCTTTSKSAKEFACTVCESSFSNSKACSDHWKEYHSSERPHQCRTCGRRFTLVRALQKHAWTHY